MIFVRLLMQTVFLAFGQIWSHKVRSMLTTLGVIIGVAAVVSIVAVLDGLRADILSEFEKIGTKRVFIDGTLPVEMRNKTTWREVQLKLEEVEAIVERCPSIEKITPLYWGTYPVEYGIEKLDAVSVVGIWNTWHEIEHRQVIQGRPFSSIDEAERRNVCLVNDKAIDELALPRDPTGEFVLIGGRRFMIVGVVETIQSSAMFGGGDTSTEMWIPFETARNLNPDAWIAMAWGQLSHPDKVEDAKAEIRGVLRQMRKLGPNDPDTFEVQVLQQYIDQFNSMARVMQAGAAGIVSISLLVGGIGIMNIMLVSVSERTREIGLRKSIGARPDVILIQFLVEAVMLCLAGAAVGVGIGQALVLAVSSIPDAPLENARIPMWAIVLSGGFSAATGVVFGMFPAIKAARLDPIEALRHE